jgi:ribosomal 50S subunit-recycling heat shock protein
MRRRLNAMMLLATGLISVTPANGTQRTPAPSPEHDCCPVLELRRYTLKQGQRDGLIALFDRHFIESQEALGMTIVGQFRDRRRSDRFVWIRGFVDMRTRHAALEQFYGGAVWAQHSRAANETMIDVGDVLLLRPAPSTTSFRIDTTSRPALGEVRPPAPVLVGIHRLRAAADATLVLQFQKQVIPALSRDGVDVESVFVTESAHNTFTRLPVREGEHVLVWFATLRRSDVPSAQRLEVSSAMFAPVADGPLEILELEPTPRSLLGHHRAQ